MEKYIDLHTHSSASDGSMTPSELVRYAKEKGLSAIALTDHDTVDGVSEALKEGNRIGLEVVPGIEISVLYTPEMHILGYFPDIDKYMAINNELTIMKRGREDRNRKIIDKLNEIGVSITEEEVKGVALGDITGRPHIARVLVEKGYVKTINDAFEKYLGKEGKAYFKRFELKPIDGITAIKNAGGIPVIAHPVFLKKSYSEMNKLLKELKGYGLEGIEAIYSEHNREDTGSFLRLAIENDLLVTGGSDFHGSFKEGLDIGTGRGNLKVSYELLEKLRRK